MELTYLKPRPLGDGKTVECENLRVNDDGHLAPVGKARVIATGVAVALAAFATAGARRQVVAALSDGRIVIIDREGAVSCIVGRMSDGMIPACGLAVGNYIYLMPASGSVPEIIAMNTRTGVWKWKGESAMLRRLRIKRVDSRLYTHTIESRELEGDYNSRSTSLVDADARQLARDMVDAYTDICDRAAASRCYVQPVLARYRLLDDEGHIIYESAPQLVTPASGVQMTGATMAASLSGAKVRLGQGTLSATGFRLEVDWPAINGEIFRSMVRLVELIASPQIHPLLPDAPVTSEFSSLSTMSGTLQVTLPGMKQPVAGPNTVFRARILGMLGCMKQWDISVPCYNPMWRDMKEQMAGMLKLEKQAPRRDENPLLTSVSAPNTFTARVGCRSGATVMWGDLKVRPFRGYVPMEIASSVLASRSQPAATRVTLDNGLRVVSATTEEDTASDSYSPLLLYPSGSARKMEIFAGEKKGEYDLQPTPCGKWSYYLANDCRPIRLPETVEAYAVPEEDDASVEYADVIVTAHADQPMKPLGAAKCGNGRITAITPAARSQSAWDFARTHFYAFATSGIHTTAVTANMTQIKTSLIDGRGVSSGQAVATTSAGVAAVAGGQLLMVRGSSATTLSTSAGGEMLAWCGRHGELWIIGADGGVTVYDTSGRPLYKRSDFVVQSVLSEEGSALILDIEGQLRDTARETREAPGIRWSGRLNVPKRVDKITWRLFGRCTDAYLKVMGDNGLGPGRLVTAMKVNGLADRPVEMRLAGPNRTRLTLLVEGDMAIDSSIEELILKSD